MLDEYDLELLDLHAETWVTLCLSHPPTLGSPYAWAIRQHLGHPMLGPPDNICATIYLSHPPKLGSPYAWATRQHLCHARLWPPATRAIILEPPATRATILEPPVIILATLYLGNPPILGPSQTSANRLHLGDSRPPYTSATRQHLDHPCNTESTRQHLGHLSFVPRVHTDLQMGHQPTYLPPTSINHLHWGRSL